MVICQEHSHIDTYWTGQLAGWHMFCSNESWKRFNSLPKPSMFVSLLPQWRYIDEFVPAGSELFIHFLFVRILGAPFFSFFFLQVRSWTVPPAHIQTSLKGRNIEQLEWMKHRCEWNINLVLGDGLAALTSACESRLALDQMKTESSILYVPLITTHIKMFPTPAHITLHWVSGWIHGGDLICIDFPF